MTNLTQLPIVDADKLDSIITQLDAMTWIENGTFTTPEAMGDLFQHIVTVYGQDDSLRMALTDAWQRVQGNFITTGKAVSWIAMQQAMIEELRSERDSMIQIGYESCEAEIMAEEISALMDTLLDCGCEEEQADMFLQMFYNGSFDETAKSMIRDLVSHSYEVAIGELENVN